MTLLSRADEPEVEQTLAPDPRRVPCAVLLSVFVEGVDVACGVVGDDDVVFDERVRRANKVIALDEVHERVVLIGCQAP